MRAARLHRYDPDLAGPEFLQFDEVDEPAITEPDDVIVRVGGSGVCRTDLHIIQGVWDDGLQTDLPYTLGHENAGWVEEAGAAARSVAPGDAVVVLPGLADGTCDVCRRGLDNRCPALVWQGIQVDGGFTGFLRTKSRNLVPIPEELSPAEAAPYADAGITAYHAAKIAVRDVVPGETVAVIGIGGLGHVAIQVLKALTPARIVAIDRSKEALALAGRFGADHAVLAETDSVAEVLDLTGGAGCAAVIDFVGEGEVPAQAFSMAGAGGRYVVVGYGGTLEIPALDIMGTERQIVGAIGGTYSDLRELLALAADGRVELLTVEYPFEEVNRALGDLAAGRLRGRGVLVHT
ncbi:MAG TPA: NAD(P)-dependent alcohol dehydrogenase [Egibacteraceae bacterium]|nr:NAD(P)-dependent alcohol dehydrogenase [Egibacteraceae bacterium]